MKPVAAGTDAAGLNDDVEAPRRRRQPRTGRGRNRPPAANTAAVAPHIAAAEEGRRIDFCLHRRHLRRAGRSGRRGGDRGSADSASPRSGGRQRRLAGGPGPVILVVGLRLGLYQPYLTAEAIAAQISPWRAGNRIDPAMARCEETSPPCRAAAGAASASFPLPRRAGGGRRRAAAAADLRPGGKNCWAARGDGTCPAAPPDHTNGLSNRDAKTSRRPCWNAARAQSATERCRRMGGIRRYARLAHQAQAGLHRGHGGSQGGGRSPGGLPFEGEGQGRPVVVGEGGEQALTVWASRQRTALSAAASAAPSCPAIGPTSCRYRSARAAKISSSSPRRSRILALSRKKPWLIVSPCSLAGRCRRSIDPNRTAW